MMGTCNKPQNVESSKRRNVKTSIRLFDFLTFRLFSCVAWASTAVVARAQEPPPPTPERKVDDLARKLIDQAASDADEDLMASIMRLMSDAAQRLEIRFDPGGETQTVQRTILTKLDEAVKVAAARRRPMRSRSQTASADKRRMPKNRPDKRPGAKDSRAAVTARDTSSAQRTDAVKRAAGPGGELQETRRTWGQLPMRDREEIIQGIGEQFLERYRAWIERYYRALQESDE